MTKSFKTQKNRYQNYFGMTGLIFRGLDARLFLLQVQNKVAEYFW